MLYLMRVWHTNQLAIESTSITVELIVQAMAPEYE